MPVRLLIATLATSLGLASAGASDPTTYEFEAADFTETAAGEVPYYFDGQRQAWAIDAAITEHRGKFARATVVFTGETGTYTITLAAMRETDGDCTYRIYVDNELIGEGTNVGTEVDYARQEHVFEGVKISAGSTLAVESNAVTNGKIPEGDGTAFARGRWTSLDLQAE
jgi:hypothetical protein